MFFFMLRLAGWDKETIVCVLTELINAHVWLKMEESLL